jgi:hypothetical protein
MRHTIILFLALASMCQAAVVPSLVPKTPYPKPQGGKINVVDVAEGKQELERFGKMLIHFNPQFAERVNRPMIRVDSSPPIAASPQLHSNVGLLIEDAIGHVGLIRVVSWEDLRAGALGGSQALPQPLKLPVTRDRWILSTNDIIDLPSLAALLATRSNAVSVYLLDRFTDVTRQLLGEYLKDSSKAPRLLTLLVTELNLLLEGDSFFDAGRFADVRLRPVTAAMVADLAERTKKDKDFKIGGIEALRLNRLLLEDTYPVQFARDHTVRDEEIRISTLWEHHPYLRRWSITPIVISGGFTRYDERIDTQNRSAEASLYFDFAGSSATPKALSADLGVEFENELTGISLTLKAADNEGATIIPGCVVDASGVVAKAKRKQNFGFFFFGNGLNFAGQATRANGPHDVCIRMVDRSTLAILGKHFRLPYWRCIRGGQPDGSVVDLIIEDFKYGLSPDPKQREKLQIWRLKVLLEMHGYRKMVASDEMDPGFVEALRDYCRKQKLDLDERKPSDDQFAKMYAQLHMTAPIPGFPSADQDVANAKSPEAGVIVEFSGFPPAYKDILYKVLSDSTDVREVSEQAPIHGAEPALWFKADMYFDDAKRLAKHIENTWPKRKLDSRENCEAEVINDRYVRVYFKTGRVKRDVAR